MAMVSMKEAAGMAGVGRTTLYRKADQGLLSTTKMPDGSRKIDTAELFRVFPADSGELDTVGHAGHEVDNLKKEVEYLKSIIVAKDQVIEVQAAALRMLEYRQPLPVTVPPAAPVPPLPIIADPPPFEPTAEATSTPPADPPTSTAAAQEEIVDLKDIVAPDGKEVFGWDTPPKRSWLSRLFGRGK